jgi:hypothetical protein
MRAAAFILPKGKPYDDVLRRLTGFIGLLDKKKGWRIEVSEQKSKRTNSQNAYLWGVVYPAILEAGGETLRGWTNDDLHEYFLGEHHGWEVVEGFGKKRMRPIKRSSNLSVSEFMAYLEFIERKMASVGIYIPSPQGGFDG